MPTVTIDSSNLIDDIYLQNKTQPGVPILELGGRRTGLSAILQSKSPHSVTLEGHTTMKPFLDLYSTHTPLTSKLVHFWLVRVTDVPEFHPYLPSSEV